MNTQKIVHLALSLMIGGSLLSACGPAANAPRPNATGNNANNNTGNTQQGSSAAASAQLSAELQAVVSDDTTFSDTQAAADGSFSTQAIGIPRTGEVSATGMLGTGGTTRLGAALRTVRRTALNASTRTELQARAKARAEMAKSRKDKLEASGALTVNADGTITVDPAKLKAFVKANAQTRRAKFQEHVAKIKDRLQARKEVAKDRLDKLRRKNNVVRTSDVVETSNADGSVTKTVTVEFKNEKTGVTRTSTSSRTTKDKNLVSAHYELKVTGPDGFERNVSRDVTVAADGTRTATTEASTKWPGGRTHERSETRVVNPDGSATGSGTITITHKDGSTKTFDYSVGIDINGNEVAEGDDDADSGQETAEETVAVTVEAEANAEEVTVVVEADGAAATETETPVENDSDVVEEDAQGEDA